MSLLALLLLSCDEAPAPSGPVQAPCASVDPLRQLWWGDLHVHTAFSFDAQVYDVRVTPAQALGFAKGETVYGPPLDASGQGTRPLRLDRPLDFAAITDHAEYLAEVGVCTDPSAPGYETELCEAYRSGGPSAIQRFGVLMSNPDPERFEELCGPEGVDCRLAAYGAWAEEIRAAQYMDDASADCRFTALVGYEWSGTPNVSNFHRNVIFRTDEVPALPTSYFEASTPEDLWEALEETCVSQGDCDVLAIPHNSNAANGNMFQLEVPFGGDAAEAATFRARYEPLIEVYQHKGDSECLNGLSGVLGQEDELCGFEKWGRETASDCGDGTGGGGLTNTGCASQLDYLRGILLEGLSWEQEIGVNPFQLGVIASTDTHSGTPGAVVEEAFEGHLGVNEDEPLERLDRPQLNPGGVVNSPGGLVAVWAEENSREALFDALRRREVYGTSGPRISVRYFGGFGLPEDICERPDWVEAADAAGVPMGGVLGQGEGPPTFVISALADPGGEVEPAWPLERLQIIKGHVDAQGLAHLDVIEVTENQIAASLDPETCSLGEGGAMSLCGTWTDPDFDPEQPAFYYARVVEAPRCRWSAWDCLSLPVQERPESCTADDVPWTLQERAWTSPIWY